MLPTQEGESEGRCSQTFFLVCVSGSPNPHLHKRNKKNKTALYYLFRLPNRFSPFPLFCVMLFPLLISRSDSPSRHKLKYFSCTQYFFKNVSHDEWNHDDNIQGKQVSLRAALYRLWEHENCCHCFRWMGGMQRRQVTYRLEEEWMQPE